MGELFEAFLTIKPYVDEILARAKEVENARFAGALDAEVYNIFRSLCPLSSKNVFVSTSFSDGGKVRVKKWISICAPWETRGRPVDQYRFVSLILDIGEKIAPFVRKEIREEFSELLNLTKRLREVKNIVAVKDMSLSGKMVFQVSSSSEKRYRVRSLSIGASSPFTVVVTVDSEKNPLSFHFHEGFYVETAVLLEEVLPDIVSLEKNLYRSVVRQNKRNKMILSKMREVVAPYNIVGIFD